MHDRSKNLTWILFLRILDAQELRDQEQAEAVAASFTSALREVQAHVAANQAQRAELERLPQRLLAQVFEPHDTVD